MHKENLSCGSKSSSSSRNMPDQKTLQYLLGKLNLDVNYDKHVPKGTKRLPKKYFQNVSECVSNASVKFTKNSTEEKVTKQNLNLDIKNETAKSSSNNSFIEIKTNDSDTSQNLVINIVQERVQNQNCFDDHKQLKRQNPLLKQMKQDSNPLNYRQFNRYPKPDKLDNSQRQVRGCPTLDELQNCRQYNQHSKLEELQNPSMQNRQLPRRFKNPELFNPDYNFNKMKQTGRTLIDSIREKVFQQQQHKKRRETDYENDWNDDYYEDKPKLPKETRNAMMMMGNSLKSNMICKCCQERVYRAKLLKNNETQTTPTLSRTDIRNSIFKNFNKIPCPKNLLCEQGLHSGKCNVTIRPNLTCNICSSNCPCQQEMCWPGKAERISRNETVTEQSSEESFIKLMEPKKINSDSTVSIETIKPMLEKHFGAVKLHRELRYFD